MKTIALAIIFAWLSAMGVALSQTGGAYIYFAATNAALTLASSTTARAALREDYSTGLGSPPQIFYSSNAPCSLNAGAGDGGSQVPTADGKCWLAQFSGDIDVRIFGANGTATDSVNIQNAINAASALGGRRVIFPALGKAYLINTGLVLGDGSRSGASIIGAAGEYWPGPYDNVEADWTQKGTWFHCADLVNPCISVGGGGNDIDGISFWYTQPTPTSDSSGPCTTNPCSPLTFAWTPTTYPYTISVTGTFNHIRNIVIANATHCLDFEGPTNGQAIFDQYVEHAFLACFTRGTKFVRVDNTPVLSDIHYHVKWFTFSSDVLGWMQGNNTHACNRIDWEMGYVAALHANAIEFFESCAAIYAYDATVTNGVGVLTFAVQSGNWSDITFSQVCQAIILQNATTHFDANLANVVLSVDPSTSTPTQCGGFTPVAFGLNSDNVNVRISNLDILDAQTIVNLGGGSPGVIPPYFSADINLVQTYSQYTNGNAAFIAAAGACLDIRGINKLFSQNASAGPHFSGAGVTSIGSGCPTSRGLMQALTGPESAPRQFLFQADTATAAAALGRWGIVAEATTSDLGFFRYNNSGAFVDIPFAINRASGMAFVNDGLTASGTINLNGASGAGASSKTVCVDASGIVLLKAGAC